MECNKPFAMAAAAVFALSLATTWALDLPTFEELDADNDGFISESEATALPCLAENYDRIARSDRRGLNPAEYRQSLNSFCR